jgi:hypothetical protein
MAQSECIDEEVDSYPPSIPQRNPLREYSSYQAGRRLTKAVNDNNGTVLSSSVTPTTFTNTEWRLEATQNEPLNNSSVQEYQSLSLDNKHSTATMIERGKGKETLLSSKTTQSAPLLRLQEKTSLANTKSSLTDGLKRYPAYFDHGNPPDLHDDSGRQARRHEIDDAMARIRNSLDISDTLTSILSCDRDIVKVGRAEEGNEDARVEAWLQRGAFDAQAPESDCASKLRRSTAVSITTRPQALTIFPPASPVTGMREYASPLSPMDNGRDAYGNYIPTNTRDYVGTPLSPNSSKLQSILEDASGLSKSSVPSLRGGGGWWNNLGISQAGKQPGLSEQKSSPRVAPPTLGITAESLRGEGTVGSQCQLGRLGNDGKDLQSGHVPPRPTVPSHGQSSVRVDDDWSDLTDIEKEFIPPQTSKQWELSANAQFGSVQNRRKGNIRTPTPSAPTSPGRIRTQRDVTLGQLTAPSSSGYPPSCTDPRAGTMGDSSVPRRPLFHIEKPSSPLSEASYRPRAQKRWYKDHTARSPPRLPLPPPPPPKSSGPARDINSSVGEMSTGRYWQERPPSEAESYDDGACELQSLQLGESVSVTGYAPQSDVPRVAIPQQVDRIRPKDFEAQQLDAQVRFRPKCMDIIMRYNAECSRDKRALQLGEMSLETYQRQNEYLVRNVNNALQHSAERAGYVVSFQHSNSFSIGSHSS